MEIIYSEKASAADYALSGCKYPDCFECGQYCGAKR